MEGDVHILLCTLFVLKMFKQNLLKTIPLKLFEVLLQPMQLSHLLHVQVLQQFQEVCHFWSSNHSHILAGNEAESSGKDNGK